MMTLFRKKVMISVFLLSVYFYYLSFRVKHKRERLRLSQYSQLEYVGGPPEILDRCKKLGQVLITVASEVGPEFYKTNAKYLFYSDFGPENVCKSKRIDICPGNSECVNMDIRTFVLKYFRELEKRGVVLKKRFDARGKSFVYDIFPDSEELKADKYDTKKQGDELKANTYESKKLKEELRIFGMMLGLAVVHRVYLGIKFETHFLYSANSSDYDLIETLEVLDPEQYELYKKLKYQCEYGYEKCLKFMPESSKPFRDLNDPDPLAIEYLGVNFPLHQAILQIFFEPYTISRKLIFEGMKRVFYEEYYSVAPNHVYVRNGYINYNEIFWEYSTIYKLHDLKDNLDNDKNSKLFLKALKHFSDAEIEKIYRKTTGFEHLPLGGFSRLPRIRIVTGKGEMFPRTFVIVIEPGITESELVDKIRDNIKDE